MKKTQLRTSTGWTCTIRRNGEIVARTGSKTPAFTLRTLDTSDLDYALAFGRRNWPHLAHCLEAVQVD